LYNNLQSDIFYSHILIIMISLVFYLLYTYIMYILYIYIYIDNIDLCIYNIEIYDGTSSLLVVRVMDVMMMSSQYLWLGKMSESSGKMMLGLQKFWDFKNEHIYASWCIKYASNMHQICIKYASNMHQICIKYASNMHQTEKLCNLCYRKYEFGTLRRWLESVPAPKSQHVTVRLKKKHKNAFRSVQYLFGSKKIGYPP